MSAGREPWSGTRLLRKVRQVAHNQRVAHLKPRGPASGRVLLSYIHDPFLSPREPLPRSHTHYWESVQIARTYLELGCAVDVISYHNRTFRPSGTYDVLVDPRWNLERLHGRLNDDCIRVMHIDTAHLTFQNAAESRRLLQVQTRRGATLQPRRFERPNLGIEYADRGVIIGNATTMATYAFAGKPLHPIPVTESVSFDEPLPKDHSEARKRFVWFGSGGLVLKGLDLVLEIFARCPDLHLTVCGPVDRERDFVRAYRRELYETGNITTLGWVDVGGAEFREVLSRSAAIVYPSASEGQSGAVVQCMHAGVIPIVSRETGIDLTADTGVVLEDCAADTIEQALRSVAERPAHELAEMARRTWALARERHSREAFARRYRSLAEELLQSDRSERARPLGPRTSP
jgi:glycosyltransferase involved in cell wall biosynthesis